MHRSFVAAVAALFACSAHAQLYLQAELRSPQPEEDAAFGATILDAFNSMIVGAPATSAAGIPGVGAVYSFDRTDYAQAPAELRPLQAIAHAAYGASLSGGGWAIVIGAPGGSDVANDPAPRGMVDSWNLGPAWVHYGTISPPPSHTGTEFGRSVSYSNQALVAGFPGRTDKGLEVGGAQVFYEQSGDWGYQGTISLFLGNNRFGEHVTSAGAATFVTDPTESTVYYFDVFTTSGTLPKPTPGEDLTSFGSTVLYSTDVFVGTPYPRDFSGNPLPGRVYVYRFIPNQNYELIGTITSPDAEPGDGFGASIDQWGTEFAIGAPGATVANLPNAGAVWCMYDTGLAWVPARRLVSTRPQAEGRFGAALSWQYGSLGIGAPGETAAGVPRAGTAYVFAADSDVIFQGSFDYL